MLTAVGSTVKKELSPFAQQLARARAMKGWSQRFVGESLGAHGGTNVSGSAVGEWERDESVPGRRQARALDRLFAEPLSESLGYVGEDVPLTHERLSKLEEQMAEVLEILRSLGRRPGAPSGER